jgi:2-oxo-4-hydroxy-4-carboxy-5-ureidoimidazoline decarboxylase
VSSILATEEAHDGISRFNALDVQEARTVLESCLAVSRWVEEVLAGRPYAASQVLLDRAAVIVQTLTAAEVDAALARHPRIGEQPGVGHDAEFSMREQAGVDGSDDATVQALRAANADYERRFDRVFLIRAAGRTSGEVLSELRRRVQNSDEVETAEVVTQLGEIAVRRLEQVISE